MYIRQSDGSVLDWLPDDEGSVLMARTYVPRSRSAPPTSRTSALGLGVDRVELATLRVEDRRGAQEDASNYMSDGRGNVRIMAFSEFDGTIS